MGVIAAEPMGACGVGAEGGALMMEGTGTEDDVDADDTDAMAAAAIELGFRVGGLPRCCLLFSTAAVCSLS